MKKGDDISLDVVLVILVAVIIGLAFILTHPVDEAAARQVITITVPAIPQPEKHCYLWNAQAHGLEQVACQ
jgi:hypothetical protein